MQLTPNGFLIVSSRKLLAINYTLIITTLLSNTKNKISLFCVQMSLSLAAPNNLNYFWSRFLINYHHLNSIFRNIMIYIIVNKKVQAPLYMIIKHFYYIFILINGQISLNNIAHAPH